MAESYPPAMMPWDPRNTRYFGPLKPKHCCGTHAPVQLQNSEEWDALVERAFRALDADGSGHISPEDLEHMLCGEEHCEVGAGCLAQLPVSRSGRWVLGMVGCA